MPPVGSMPSVLRMATLPWGGVSQKTLLPYLIWYTTGFVSRWRAAVAAKPTKSRLEEGGVELTTYPPRAQQRASARLLAPSPPQSLVLTLLILFDCDSGRHWWCGEHWQAARHLHRLWRSRQRVGWPVHRAAPGYEQRRHAERAFIQGSAWKSLARYSCGGGGRPAAQGRGKGEGLSG